MYLPRYKVGILRAKGPACLTTGWTTEPSGSRVSMPVMSAGAGVAGSGAAGSGVAGPAGPDSVATAAGTTWRRRAASAVTPRGVLWTW